MKKFQWIIIACKLAAFSALRMSYSSFSEELPYYKDASFAPYWLSEGSVNLDDFHKIPAFSFTDQSGQTVTDKVYVAGFFFSTCPGICPAIRSKLNKIQQQYVDDADVKIVQYSIRPTTDTVETLKAYADKNDINNEHWFLLTGDKKEIYAIAKQAYFASEDLGNVQKNKDFLHTESLLLIDQNKHIRGIYNGLNAASVDYLIKDIKRQKDSL